MIPETAVAMLACARLGAIHSVVFGGFAANELAVRIDDSAAKVIVSGVVRDRAGPGHSLQATARRRHRPRQPQADHCVVFQREQATADMQPGRDVDWAERYGHSRTRPLHPRRGDGPALCALHLRHDRGAERRGAGQWRAYGGAHLVDEAHLRHGTR